MGWMRNHGVGVLALGTAAVAVLSCSPAQPEPDVPALARSGAPLDPGARAEHVDGGDVTEAGDATVDAVGAEVAADAGPVMGCYAVACVDHAHISATLAISPIELAESKVELTLGDEHLELRQPHPIIIGARQAWDKPPEGISHWSVSQVIRPLSASLSRLDLEVASIAGLKDRERYGLKISLPGRGQVLNVSRVMRLSLAPQETYVCYRCKQVVMRLYSGSRSGIQCESNSCDAGLALYVHGPAVVRQLHSVEACRNNVCASAYLVGFNVTLREGGDATHRLNGQLEGTVEYHGSPWVSYNGLSPGDLLITIPSDSLLLADGDRYRIVLRDHAGEVLTTVERTINYDTSYPNGKTCDTVPCRRAVVHLRL